MSTQQDAVFEMLDNAVSENEYRELLTWPDTDIAADLRAYGDVDASDEVLLPIIREWRSQRGFENAAVKG